MPPKIVVDVSDDDSVVEVRTAGGDWLETRRTTVVRKKRTTPQTFPVSKKIEIVEAWLAYSNSNVRQRFRSESGLRNITHRQTGPRTTQRSPSGVTSYPS